MASGVASPAGAESGPMTRTRSFPAAITLALLLAATLNATALAAERRCGWYQNPTPGNLLLTDKDGEWWITSQGEANGPDAKGAEDKAPQMDDKQYVATQPNGYGYGCACLTVELDRKAKRITRVIAGQTVPLARCRQDKSLPKPF
jgi:hypothetical protein